MARTIAEIKKDMADTFIKERAVISAYGLDGKKTFDQQFSPVSIENILFYVFAVALWTLEKLFDAHTEEVDDRIEQLEPHTLRWYVNKAKAFMFGYRLVTDTDYYDTTGMSETDIDAARVVKYAVATESNTVVYLKVAGEKEGNPCLLTDSQFSALNSYINEIKDAGVSVQIRNEEADDMKMRAMVYYDPTLLSSDGVSLTDGGKPVEDAVRSVITNLPFDGVLRKSDLLAAIIAVPGVEVADIINLDVKPHASESWTSVIGYNRPYSGYYKIEQLTLIYEQYSKIE
jgi:hypothetical protein